MVKSVQRGETELTDSSYVKNVTINAVNMSKSFVNIQQPLIYIGNNQAQYNSAVAGVLTSSTNLRLYTSTYIDLKVAWEVIEFY